MCFLFTAMFSIGSSPIYHFTASVFLVYLFLWCSPRLCSWYFTFHPKQYTLSLSVVLSPPFHWITTFMQMTLNFSSPFIHQISTHLQNALQHISSGMTANLLTRSSYRTWFLLIGLKKLLAKIHNSLLNTTSASSLTNTSPFHTRTKPRVGRKLETGAWSV